MHHRRPHREEIQVPIRTPAHRQQSTAKPRAVLTSSKTDIVQTVKQRKPRRLKNIRPRLLIPNAKLLIERIHRLRRGERLVVKSIIKRRHGDEHA